MRGQIKIEKNILRIRVRILAIRLTVFAFTLVLSYVAPKAGSAWVRPHPTVETPTLVYLLGRDSVVFGMVLV